VIAFAVVVLLGSRRQEVGEIVIALDE
jgi:hypothetical protein